MLFNKRFIPGNGAETDDKPQRVPSAFCLLMKKYPFIQTTADSSRNNNINHVFGTVTTPPPGFYISGPFKYLLLIDDTSVALVNMRTGGVGGSEIIGSEFFGGVFASLKNCEKFSVVSDSFANSRDSVASLCVQSHRAKIPDIVAKVDFIAYPKFLL